MKLNISDKNIVDVASIVTVTGTLVNMLPAIAAVFTIVWTGIRIWETETVSKLLGRDTKKPHDSDESQG